MSSNKKYPYLDYTFGDVVIEVATFGRGNEHTSVTWEGSFESKLLKRQTPFSVEIGERVGEPTENQRESFLWLKANEMKLKASIQAAAFEFHQEHYEEWNWDPVKRPADVWSGLKFESYFFPFLKESFDLNFSVPAEIEHGFFVEFNQGEVTGAYFAGTGLGRRIDKTPVPGSRRFVFDEGGTRKFWNLLTVKKQLTVHFGRIGTAGQTKQKTFANSDTMQVAAEKLIREKTGKGYQELTLPTRK